jgi:hypothetical protein
MSDLSIIEKRSLERLFGMGSGYFEIHLGSTPASLAIFGLCSAITAGSAKPVNVAMVSCRWIGACLLNCANPQLSLKGQGRIDEFC